MCPYCGNGSFKNYWDLGCNAQCDRCNKPFVFSPDNSRKKPVLVKVAFEIEVTENELITLLEEQTVVHLRGRVEIAKGNKVPDTLQKEYERLKIEIKRRMALLFPSITNKLANVFWDTDHVITKREQLDIIAPKG